MYLTSMLSAILLEPLVASSLSVPPPLSLSLPDRFTLPQNLSVASDVLCHRINEPPMMGLNPSNCETASEILCQHYGSLPPRQQWRWIEQPGCAVAFWRAEGVMPSAGFCTRIWAQIIEKCAYDSRYNAGSENVAELPDFSQDGRPKSTSKTMWLFAPERLTL